MQRCETKDCPVPVTTEGATVCYTCTYWTDIYKSFYMDAEHTYGVVIQHRTIRRVFRYSTDEPVAEEGNGLWRVEPFGGVPVLTNTLEFVGTVPWWWHDRFPPTCYLTNQTFEGRPVNDLNLPSPKNCPR